MKTATAQPRHRVGYKLFRVRRDGSLGSLFINRRARLVVGGEYISGVHPTKGFAVRPGWHITAAPRVPHLSTKGRMWFRVAFRGNVVEHVRPVSQGGLWYTAKYIKILNPVRTHQGEPLCRA
jgi:hypothetical protein